MSKGRVAITLVVLGYVSLFAIALHELYVRMQGGAP